MVEMMEVLRCRDVLARFTMVGILVGVGGVDSWMLRECVQIWRYARDGYEMDCTQDYLANGVTYFHG